MSLENATGIKICFLFCSENWFFSHYLYQGHLSKQSAEAATKRFSEKKIFCKYQETVANNLESR